MLLIFIILGFIQGITEPIPISSSGHLLIFKNLFNYNIDYTILTTMTNFGSFLAIIIIFKHETKQLVIDFFTKKNYTNYKYCWLIIIGTIPAGIVGLIITKLNMFNYLENNIKLVGITLLITALFLFLIRNSQGIKDKKNISFYDAFVIGLFQTIALIPGISRSGSTIIGGTFRNLKRETAFNFSFMLYIPISICTTIIGIKDIVNSHLTVNQTMLYLASTIIAFIVTYVSANIFKKIVINGKLIYFVYYCLIIGTLVLLFL